jgi:tRNA (guanine10-N2)-methyltransferase
MSSREKHITPWRPHEIQHVIEDLLDFASKHLLIHGRLVYWLPTTETNEAEGSLMTHPSFRVISTSLQIFGKWARWLITAEKIAELAGGLIIPPAIRAPGRQELRRKVYTKESLTITDPVRAGE